MARRALDYAGKLTSGTMLVLLYVFLYAPILLIIYTSFSKDIVWPFPPQFSLKGFELLWIGRTYHEALVNSLILGLGSAVICTIFATLGSIAVLRYQSRWRRLVVITHLCPLFIANLLVGISSLVFNRQVLGLPGNMLLGDHPADDLAGHGRRLHHQLHPGLQQPGNLVLQSRRYPDPAIDRMGLSAPRPGTGTAGPRHPGQRRRFSGLRVDVYPDALSHLQLRPS